MWLVYKRLFKFKHYFIIIVIILITSFFFQSKKEITKSYIYISIFSEAVTGGVLWKKLFLKLSQNSLEKTSVESLF